MIVAVDPGVRGCGVSVWRPTGELAWAGYLPVPGNRSSWAESARGVGRKLLELGARPPSMLVLEVPEIYGRRGSRGDPNDLITVALVVGAVAGYATATSITTYLPKQWKRQVPKEVTEARAKATLRPIELSRVQLPAPSLAHNVWDAVGLGLFYVRPLRAKPAAG